MFSVSQGQEEQPSASDMNVSGESQPPLTPEQVRAGTTVMMAHTERQEFWKNSRICQLLGFSHWLTESENKEGSS